MQIEKACWNLELQVRRWKVAGKVFQFQVQLQSKLVSQRVRRSQTLFSGTIEWASRMHSTVVNAKQHF